MSEAIDFPMTIAVVIPTLNAAAGLAATIASLAAAREAGLVAEIVVADGGSSDATAAIAAHGACRTIVAPRGRGSQIAAGIAQSSAPWLLLLHADTRLAAEWESVAAAWIARPDSATRAAHFRFRLDDDAPAARRLARVVDWRSRRLGLPYGDQGLLIHRAFLAAVGGMQPIPLMEDVELVRRIGRRRLDALPADAITSAARWQREGYVRRSARNLACLSLYFLGVPPATLHRLYG